MFLTNIFTLVLASGLTLANPIGDVKRGQNVIVGYRTVSQVR